MPKRKRMSFTVKKHRVSSTPTQPAAQKAQKRRGRPQKTAAAAATRKHHMPSPDNQNEAEEDEGREETAEEPSEGEEEEDTGTESRVNGNGNGTKDRGRDEEEEEDDDDDDDDDDDERYGEEEAEVARHTISNDSNAHVKSVVVHVPKSTIEKKWTTLDADAQASVVDLFDSVAQPVLAAHMDADTLRRGDDDGDDDDDEVQVAISKVQRALKRRLPRMPFPPPAQQTTDSSGSGDGFFEHEALLRAGSALEKEAAARSRHVGELEHELQTLWRTVEQRGNEAHALEAEYEREKDALLERHQGPFGPLLQMPDTEPADSARRIKLAPWKGGATADSSRTADTDLSDKAKRLVDQLQDHLGNIQVDPVSTGEDGETDVVGRAATLAGNPLQRRGRQRLPAG